MPLRLPTIALGAGLAAFAVALGAFGAHAVRGWATPAQLQTWQTAVTYHFWHALSLIVLGGWPQTAAHDTRWVRRGFVAGIVLFSGSLYLLVLTDLRWLGAITPLGGGLWIVSWLGWAWIARHW